MVIYGNKTNINMPEMFWKTMPGRTVAIVSQARGEEPATVLHINDYIVDNYDISSDIQFLKQNETTLDNLQPYIDSINAHSSFIWGNVMSGGICCWYTGTTVKFCWFQGYFINDSTGYYRFNIGDIYNRDYKWLSEFILYDRESNGIRLYSDYYEDINGIGVNAEIIDPENSTIVANGVYTILRYKDANNSTGKFDSVFSYHYVSLQPSYPLPINSSEWPMIGFQDNGSTGCIDFAQLSTSLSGYTYHGERYGDTAEDPNAYGGTSGTGGGNGDHNNNSDEIDFSDPTQFTYDGINNGFLTLYNPNETQIQLFNDFLFTDITDALSLQLKRLISDPLDYVVSLSMIHLSPNTTGSGEIKFCGIGSGVTAPIVDNRYMNLDCGILEIYERFKSALDYSSFTKCKIYLPYCGVFPLSIDDIMAGSIHLMYHIDLLTGACSAQLKIHRNERDGLPDDCENLDSVLYEFTGNCISSLPLSATDWRGFFQGACSIASGIGSLATGNPVGAAAGIAGSVSSMKPDIVKSGNLSIDYGYMGIQTPYIILERPIQSLPENFGGWEGYPSNIFEVLGNLSGYTKISADTLWTGGIHGTDAEMDELKALFNEGVYIESWS